MRAHSSNPNFLTSGPFAMIVTPPLRSSPCLTCPSRQPLKQQLRDSNLGVADCYEAQNARPPGELQPLSCGSCPAHLLCASVAQLARDTGAGSSGWRRQQRGGSAVGSSSCPVLAHPRAKLRSRRSLGLALLLALRSPV